MIKQNFHARKNFKILLIRSVSSKMFEHALMISKKEWVTS